MKNKDKQIMNLYMVHFSRCYIMFFHLIDFAMHSDHAAIYTDRYNHHTFLAFVLILIDITDLEQ